MIPRTVGYAAAIQALSLTVVLTAQQTASPRFESTARTVAVYATVTNARDGWCPT